MLRAAAFCLLGVTATSSHAQGGPPYRTDDPETPGNKHLEIDLGWIGDRTPAQRLPGPRLRPKLFFAKTLSKIACQAPNPLTHTFQKEDSWRLHYAQWTIIEIEKKKKARGHLPGPYFFLFRILPANLFF